MAFNLQGHWVRDRSRQLAASLMEKASSTSLAEALVLLLLATLSFIYSVISLLHTVIAPECHLTDPTQETFGRRLQQKGNPDRPRDPCGHLRYLSLGGLTQWECDMCCRLVLSLVCGSIVGWERARVDRAVGVRTMSIICLGSAAFTVGGMFCELSGPQSWDTARVSADVVKGVGFLGGAAIWKSGKTPEVHGLTTACSVWLAAAIGMMVGGALYVLAFYTVVAATIFLRFAPRSAMQTEPACAEDAKGHGQNHQPCDDGGRIHGAEGAVGRMLGTPPILMRRPRPSLVE